MCGSCGLSYKHITTNGRHYWNCRTFQEKGKSFCHAKQIPEKILETVTAEVLGLDAFDGEIFLSEIDHIEVPGANQIIYVFKDGRMEERTWKDPSRRDSWTPEMKEAARQRALKQRRSKDGFTVDFLTKKTKANEGEVPQYYIEHSHEAIIDPQEWDAVQDEFRRRKEIGKAYSGKSVLSCKLICGDCGAYYGSKTWHSNDKYRAIIWQCNSKFDKEKERCRTLHITEQEIKSRFLKVYNGMIEDKESYIIAASEACRVICDTDALDSEINELLREIEVVTEMTRRCISKNAEAAQDQESYTMRYNSLVERYEKAKARYDELNLIRDERLRKGRAIKHYLSDLSGRTELLTEFDDCLWLTTVQSVVVKRDGELLFRFFSGIQVEG